MGRRFLSRRTMLRGALGGAVVSVGLPPLEAMLGNNGAHADGTEDLPFFGVFFWAHGLPWHAGHSPKHAAGTDVWTPATTGSGYAPTPLLEPLVSHEVSVITGLEPKTEIPSSPAGQGDGHMRGFMVAMTSDRPRPEGFDHANHISTALRPTLDQYIADHPDFYGDDPPMFRSLALGVSEARLHHHGHWNAVSYNGPDSVNLPISGPEQLYDMLFDIPTDLEAVARRAQLLDAVLEDAHDLRARLGARDRNRLDDHLDHLNEIQRRLELTGGACEAPAAPVDASDLHGRTDAMAELLAVALSCNLTRVFSFMLTAPGTNHVFSNLGVPDGMHKTCHDGRWDRVRDIQRYQMEAFARMLDKLAAIENPAGGTLLDRGLVFGTSEYGEGWLHEAREHPVVIAGRACGAIAPGMHVREPRGNLSKVHVTMLRALGIETPSYGFNGAETSEDFADLLA